MEAQRLISSTPGGLQSHGLRYAAEQAARHARVPQNNDRTVVAGVVGVRRLDQHARQQVLVLIGGEDLVV